MKYFRATLTYGDVIVKQPEPDTDCTLIWSSVPDYDIYSDDAYFPIEDWTGYTKLEEISVEDVFLTVI